MTAPAPAVFLQGRVSGLRALKLHQRSHRTPLGSLESLAHLTLVVVFPTRWSADNGEPLGPDLSAGPALDDKPEEVDPTGDA